MRSSILRLAVIGAAVALTIPSIVFAAGELSDSGGSPHTIRMSFTKYVTIDPAINSSGGAYMRGVVKGDNPGAFVGYVFSDSRSDLLVKLGAPAADVEAIQAMYEVEADQSAHSLRALIRGGYDVNTNEARLDGMVLGGWLTGEHAHVQFQALPCSQTDLGTQPNAVDGMCYHGTLTITPGLDN